MPWTILTSPTDHYRQGPKTFRNSRTATNLTGGNTTRSVLHYRQHQQAAQSVWVLMRLGRHKADTETIMIADDTHRTAEIVAHPGMLFHQDLPLAMTIVAQHHHIVIATEIGSTTADRRGNDLLQTRGAHRHTPTARATDPPSQWNDHAGLYSPRRTEQRTSTLIFPRTRTAVHPVETTRRTDPIATETLRLVPSPPETSVVASIAGIVYRLVATIGTDGRRLGAGVQIGNGLEIGSCWAGTGNCRLDRGMRRLLGDMGPRGGTTVIGIETGIGTEIESETGTGIERGTGTETEIGRWIDSVGRGCKTGRGSCTGGERERARNSSWGAGRDMTPSRSSLLLQTDSHNF